MSGEADWRLGSVPEMSVVLPVYNEEPCIRGVIEELDAVLSRLEQDSEIVAVDDGSTDATPAILRDLEVALPRLRVVTLGRNSGQSRALGAGFRVTRGQWIVTMDADGQNDPADIPRLFDAIDGRDCCAGYRAERHDVFSKRWSSQLARIVRNAVLGESIIDTGCSLKLFRAELGRELEIWDGMHRFLPTLFMMRGARVRQIPVGHRRRWGGVSKYGNLSRLVRTIPHLIRVRRIKSRLRRDGALDEVRA